MGTGNTISTTSYALLYNNINLILLPTTAVQCSIVAAFFAAGFSNQTKVCKKYRIWHVSDHPCMRNLKSPSTTNSTKGAHLIRWIWKRCHSRSLQKLFSYTVPWEYLKGLWGHSFKNVTAAQKSKKEISELLSKYFFFQIVHFCPSASSILGRGPPCLMTSLSHISWPQKQWSGMW